MSKIPVEVQIARVSPRKRSKLGVILKHFPKLEKFAPCLDIGTAYGGIAHEISRIGNWTFLDSDSTQLERAMSFLVGDFVVEDISTFLKKKGDLGYYQCVTCFDTFFYFEDPECVLEGLYQCMLDDGTLLITIPVHDERNMLIKFRKLLGIEQHLELKNIDEVIMNKLKVMDFSEVEAIPFCGFFTELLQTMQDVIFGLTKKEKEAPLVADLNEREVSPLLLNVVSILSRTCSLLDRVFYFFPNYGLLIRARK